MPGASEFGVVAVECEKFRVRTELGNFGVSNNCDVVGALHC